MKSLPILIIVLFCGQIAISQPKIDSLLIKDESWAFSNSHQYEYLIVRKNDKYILYQTKYYEVSKRKEKSNYKKKRIKKIPSKIIQKLIESLNNESYPNLNIQNFGITQTWIDKHKFSLSEKIKQRYDHYWTSIQQEFLLNQLSDITNYKKAIKRVVAQEGYYTLAKDGGSKFSVSIYKKGNKILSVKADEKPFGMPWIINNRKSYNPQISKIFSEILPQNKTNNKYRFTAFDALPLALANQIYEDECKYKMQNLAVVEFKDELDDLTPTFHIIEAMEYRSSGRYIQLQENQQVFRITLQNEEMPKNMFLQYFVTRRGKTLYSRDSLLTEYPNLLNRIKSVTFLMNFIAEDTNRTLELFYFDSSAVNDYVIKDFNTNPNEWAKYDEYETTTEFEHLYCGCNYRLKANYVRKSMLFELTDEFGNSSMWFLLPDGTPVLHYFQGEKAYKYSYKDYGTKGFGIQYACVKFDKNGNIIKKK